jgi:mono/diheme cytochrome c family protein
MTSFFALILLATPPPAAPASAPASAPVSAPAAAPATVDPAKAEAAAKAWATVYSVLVSPRCMNCHPDGDRPLQTDAGVPHAMNISRKSIENGLKCATCHQTQNSEAYGIAGGPPGAPHWGLPAKEMPLIFQNRDARALCEQLKDPEQNGHRTFAQLVHHVEHDKLVIWGWQPGGGRSVPPVSHAEFVQAMKTWAAGDGACP